MNLKPFLAYHAACAVVFAMVFWVDPSKVVGAVILVPLCVVSLLWGAAGLSALADEITNPSQRN